MGNLGAKKKGRDKKCKWMKEWQGRCGWRQISVRFLSKDDWRLISQTDIAVRLPRKGQTVWHFLPLLLPLSLPVVFCRSLASSSRMAKLWLCDNLVIRSLVCYLWSHKFSLPQFRAIQWARRTRQKVINYLWHSNNILFIKMKKRAIQKKF